MNKKDSVSGKDLSFEKALSMLEDIAAELESGTLGLEDSLEKYEKGIKYARLCQSRLKEAERKIEILQKSDNGEVEKKEIKVKESSGEIAENEDVQGSLL